MDHKQRTGQANCPKTNIKVGIIFDREGVNIPRATLTSWVIQTYEAIRPYQRVGLATKQDSASN